MIANNADSVSYDDKIEIGQTKNTLDDNQAEESNLQAIPLNLNKIVIGSARDDYKYYNAFKNFLQPSKSDALIHGRFASNSIESNESSQKSKFNNQKTVSGTPSKISGNVNDEKPNFIQPRCESCNSNRDQNPPQNTNTPSQSQKEQNIESHPLKFKSSPSSIMTTLYDPQLSSSDQMSESHTELSIEDSELSQNKQNLDKASQLMQSNPNQVIDQMQNNIVGNKHHSDSTYNSHNFDELLNQMQSKYQTFHTGMSQLFDSYKSQSGSFQNMMDQQDSHSSHSKHFDFNARCQDQNGVNVDPHLSKMCHLDYRDDVEKSNLTENYQPPLNVAPTNEHKNKFVSFSDYVKMIQNVNRNSGTLLVNHKNGELLGAAVPLTEESEEQPIGHHKQGILNDLRLHIDSFTETDQEATSEPDPQVEAEIDPVVANSEPEETLQINQEDSLRNRFQLFLDKLNTRKKL